MPDEREFKIRITGDASSSVAAFQQAGQAAQQTKSKLAELTAEQKAQATAGQGAGGVQEDSKNTEELTKKTGFLNLKKTELKKLVRELGHEFPIAGMAGKMMMNPVVASLTLAIGAFSYLKQKLDEWNKALDEAAERNAQRDFLPGIEAKAKALADASAEAAAFAESLKNVGAAEDDFSKKIGVAISRLREYETAQIEVRNAEEARDLALVNLAEKQGKMSGADAIVMRSGIKEKHRKQSEQQQSDAEYAELELKEKELEHSKQQAPDLKKDADAKAAAAARLRAEQARATGELPNMEKSLAEAEKEKLDKIQKAAEARAKADSGGGAIGVRPFLGMGAQGLKNFGFGVPDKWTDRGDGKTQEQASADRAEDEARQAEIKWQNYKKVVDRDKKVIKTTPESGAGVFGDEKIAKERAQQNQNRIHALEGETGMLRETLPVRQRGREEASRIKRDTTSLDMAGELQDFGKTVVNGNRDISKVLQDNNAEAAASYKELIKRIESLEGTRKVSVPGI